MKTTEQIVKDIEALTRFNPMVAHEGTGDGMLKDNDGKYIRRSDVLDLFKSRNVPNLDRTVIAMKAYDDYKIDWDNHSTLLQQITEHEALADAVGIAFGLDTADRNIFEDCAKFVKPGRCQSTDSFIRRMIALWLTEKQEDL